jgi:hypothetical protein
MRGTADLAVALRDFEPMTVREGGWISKCTGAFLSKDGRTLLAECVAIWQGVTHNYFVRVEQKSDQVTIRIDSRTNVEKNDGVKLGIVLLAGLLRRSSPHLVLEKSNLPPGMLEGFGAGDDEAVV